MSEMQIYLSVYIITFLILQTFIPGFPKEILLVQSGISFGWLIGGIINWIGMVLGAQIAYEIMRFLSEKSEKAFDAFKKFEKNKYIEKLREKGNYGLFLSRLVPYAPNDVLSLASGFLLLPRKGYLLVSLITAIPYAFAFAYLGYIGAKYTENPDFLLKINIGLTILFTLAGVLYLGYRRIVRCRPQ